MTLSALDLMAYGFALCVLFMTPGPVWVGIIARAMSGGFHAVWPLALGVVIGDVIWPLIALLSLSWVVSIFSDIMLILRYVAAGYFIFIGWSLMRARPSALTSASYLTRSGAWAGFSAGIVLILGNPKAVLFYLGILPGFFNLSNLTHWDIIAIVTLSAIIPLIGNLILALCLDRMRTLFQNDRALNMMNKISGIILICVGVLIPLV